MIKIPAGSSLIVTERVMLVTYRYRVTGYDRVDKPGLIFNIGTNSHDAND